MELKLRDKKDCMFDAVSLGEVMLRLDPGEGRIRTARAFRAWEGGGEYNVIRGLHKCFKMKTAVLTAFAENEVGYLMEDFIYSPSKSMKKGVSILVRNSGLKNYQTKHYFRAFMKNFNPIESHYDNKQNGWIVTFDTYDIAVNAMKKFDGKNILPDFPKMKITLLESD